MQVLLSKRMKDHWVRNAIYRPYNKLRALLRRVFPNYMSFTTSLISASQQKLLILMSSPISIGPCITLQLLASPLTKWNLPVPCNIGRETWCVFQNWNGIFPTSELSFMRGFRNELMTDWWRVIINNIYLFRSVFWDYFFSTYFKSSRSV